MLEITQKITWFVLNTTFFNLKNFSKSFSEYISMENLEHNNENIERKYLRRNHFFKLKNSLSDLEKDFMELKDRELKDREKKLKER